MQGSAKAMRNNELDIIAYPTFSCIGSTAILSYLRLVVRKSFLYQKYMLLPLPSHQLIIGIHQHCPNTYTARYSFVSKGMESTSNNQHNEKANSINYLSGTVT